MKYTSLLCLSSILCSDQCPRKRLREQRRLPLSTLPLDMLSNISSFLNPKADQIAFNNLSSKDLNHSFIFHALETRKNVFFRAQSLEILRSADLMRKIEELYRNSPTYPLTLTLYQEDVSSLKALDVFSFISRVETVVFEGADRLVIKTQHVEVDAAERRTSSWRV
jgi:hypothetical protein